VLSRVLRSAMMVICPGQGSWPYGLGLGSNELIDKVSAGEHSEARFEFEEVIPDEFCATTPCNLVVSNSATRDSVLGTDMFISIRQRKTPNSRNMAPVLTV
jgi:hypothetical protein